MAPARAARTHPAPWAPLFSLPFLSFSSLLERFASLLSLPALLMIYLCPKNLLDAPAARVVWSDS